MPQLQSISFGGFEIYDDIKIQKLCRLDCKKNEENINNL